MFKDDITKDWSEGRILCFLCFLWNVFCSGHAMAHSTNGIQPDLQPNWLLAMLTFYGINKISSTTQAVQEAKNGVVKSAVDE
jgi:hypothetical protein